MAIRRSIRRSIRQNIRQGITGAPFQRFFTTTDGVNQAFTFPTQTFTGDFIIEGTIATTSSSQSALISGGIGAGGLEIIMTTGGLAEIFLAGVSVFTGLIAINDGKLNRYKLSRTGTTASLSINGVSDGSGTVSGTVTVNAIAQRAGGTLFLNGVSANIKLTDAGVLDRSYVIDENWVGPSTVLVDSVSGQNGTAVNITTVDAERFTQQADGDFLGVELWIDPATFIQSPWVDEGGGFYSIDGSQSGGVRFQNSGLTLNGLTLRASLEISNYIAGTLFFNIGGTASPTFSLDGTHTFDLVGGSSITEIRIIADATTELTASSVTTKRILETA